VTATYAVLAGGGTAGHVHPALAIADALVEQGRARVTIQFIGARRGMESRLVPEHAYPITVLDVRGFDRRITPRSVLANVGAAATGRRRRVVFASSGGCDRGWWCRSVVTPACLPCSPRWCGASPSSR
jgi:hypothetical protein